MRLQNEYSAKKKHEEEENYFISERCGVAITIVVLFLSIALFSYRYSDPSFFYFESDHDVTQNWAGSVGAFFAATLLHLFGVAAYCFVASLGLLAYMFLLGYRQGRPWISLLCLPVFITAVALIAALYNIDYVRGIPGGVIGSTINDFLIKGFNFYGTALIGWAFLWISFVMVLRVSIVRTLIKMVKSIAKSPSAFFF